MNLIRTIIAGAALGLAGGGLLSSPVWLPVAFASDGPVAQALESPGVTFPTPVDTDGLVKYDVTFNDKLVSTDVERTEIVRKIGYGRSSLVTVVHTASGVYSSDGLKSPYIKYPGIEVNVSPDWEHIRDLVDLGRLTGGIHYYGSFVIIADAARL